MPYKDKAKRREKDHGRDPEKVRANRKRYNDKNRDKIKSYYLNTKTHREEKRLLRKYGLTSKERAVLLASQGGCCATCRTPEEKASRGKLHIDHNHTTGRVRGLLCNGCNYTLGLVKEDPEVLQNLINYLGIHVGSNH